MPQDYKAGDYLVIEGPNWFPFKHQYVVMTHTAYGPMHILGLKLDGFTGDEQSALTWVEIRSGKPAGCSLECRGVTVPVEVL